jgi:hypothetical protein
MCVIAASPESRSTGRDGDASVLTVLHADSTAVCVSRMPSSFSGFADEPQTGEFTDVPRRSAALGYHWAFIAAIRM